MLTLRLPDQSTKQVPEGNHSPDDRRGHRQAARPGRRRRQGRRRRSSISTANCRDGARHRLPDPHRQGSARPSTCCGTRCAHVMARARHAALPRRATRLRPDHRQRLLLRHRLADPDHGGRLPAHRSGDEEDRRRRPSRSSASSSPTAEAAALCGDLKQELQGRTHRRRAEEVPDASASTARASSSTCAAGRTFRTPARSGRSSCSASPGPTGRTTPPASSCSGSTAPRSSARRNSTPTCTRSRRRRSATTASSASSSSCSPSARRSAAA